MLPSYVKKQPWFWSYVPFLNRQFGSTIGKTIYLKGYIYEDLLSQKPNSVYRAYLIHEQTHRDRIKKMGMFMFGFKYLFSGKFRFQEELEATKMQWKYLHSQGISRNKEKFAKSLSSWVYLWAVPYSYAIQEISNIEQNL